MTASAPIDVCIIEDDVDQQRLIAHILDGAGFTASVAGDCDQCLKSIRRDNPKVVLCDYELLAGVGLDEAAATEFAGDMAKERERAKSLPPPRSETRVPPPSVGSVPQAASTAPAAVPSAAGPSGGSEPVG